MKSLCTPEFLVTEIPPFGNIDLGISVHRLFLRGFRPGDSVDVEFSNGFCFRNIPLFTGFYGAGNMPCLYAAEKFYPNAGIGCPVSGNPWLTAGLHAGDSAHVRLRRKRGYSQLESRMRLPRMLAPNHIRPREQSANWRAILTGKIPFGALYRSCSPISSDSPAAAIAGALMQKTGVKSVLNLADSPNTLEEHAKNTNRAALSYLGLYDEGRVLALHLSIDYHLQEYASTLAHGLLWLAEQPKPALIHCKLGLDRTGMVCALLEMLEGSDYAHIEHDYQLSYLNLFGPSPDPTGSYPLCDLRFTELIDFLLSFTQETGIGEGITPIETSDAATTKTDKGKIAHHGTQDSARQHPNSETLYRAACAYLAFGGLDEGQIAQIEHMLAESPSANEGSYR